MLSVHLGAALAKTLFQTLGAPTTSALRLGLGALMLLAVWRPSLHLSRRQWPPVLIYGAALGAMNMMFYMALQRVPLGIAVTLEFTGPLALAMMSSRRPIDFLWVALAGLGIALLFPPGTRMAAIDPLGALFAVGAGACWAIYIVFGRKVSLGKGPSMVALGGSVAAVLALPFGVAYGPPVHTLTLTLLGLAFGMALLSTAIPFTLEMVALPKLSTLTFSTLMSLQPAFGAAAGWLVLGERLTALQGLAIGAVIAASLGAALTSPAPGPADGA